MTYRIDKVNSYNGWDPLKQVILGNIFTPEFFEDLPDPKQRDLTQQLLYETHEDLDNIQKTLEDLGVDVIRTPANATSVNDIAEQTTDMSKFSSVMEWYESCSPEERPRTGCIGGLPAPMLSPRDYFLVLGDKMLLTVPFKAMNGLINSGQTIINPDVIDSRLAYEADQIQRWITSDDRSKHKKLARYLGPFQPSTQWMDKHFKHGWNPAWYDPNKVEEHLEDFQFERFLYQTSAFWAPQITRVGDTLIIDTEDITNLDKVILEMYPNYKKANVAIGGHNDGSFNLPKPGLAVCCPWIDPKEFSNTLPGWEVMAISTDKAQFTKNEAGSWNDMRAITKGRYWTPHVKENPAYVNFIDTWLNKWVGYAEETLFEVNMLSIDENTILSMNYQKEVHDKLKQHGVEPIYCRFRHRNFWDAGLHCVTVDTVREGGMQNYFN